MNSYVINNKEIEREGERTINYSKNYKLFNIKLL